MEGLKRTEALVEPEEKAFNDQQGHCRQDQRTGLPCNTVKIYDPQTRHEENSEGGMNDPNQEEHCHNSEIIAPG